MKLKGGHNKIKERLDKINQLYTYSECRILFSKYPYTNYFGRAKNRTLINDNPKLYKSLLHYTRILDLLKEKYKFHFNFRHRLIFLNERDCNLNNIKCQCGLTYTWNTYCNYCDDHPYKTHAIGSTHTRKALKKMRLSAIKRIKAKSGQCFPNYNPAGCKILNEHMQISGSFIQHAENGGEFYVYSLGYWVDGYDKVNNIVYEIDELGI